MATQIEIAEFTGLSQGHLSRLFRGNRPIGKKTAQIVAGILGVRWNEVLILTGTEIREKIIQKMEGDRGKRSM
jgi:transcriptional regulator with XRE-family HTH domain